MSVHQHGEENREEFASGRYRGADERVEVADGEVDEVLSESGRQSEPQQRALHTRNNETINGRGAASFDALLRVFLPA